ncbi:hypothetical protein CF336_g3624 [Tilletia laevis]|uniref:Uncharacterized protein n=1 Tax=Tilletia caries TaxID=13290 RepID=A0A177UPX8_9BASI|nr:hypothetical protein CF336_g3624 [Tilletia laevis]KAE8203798.1 hypothetical protein CF335_g2888 [Tilletia laevis]KAE8257389.1 hypothetical protein A4X03_0g4689 [Tilletia caries]
MSTTSSSSPSPIANNLLGMALHTMIQLAQGKSPTEAVVDCANIIKAAQQSPLDNIIPNIGNRATANKVQLIAESAGEANMVFSEMVAVMTKASRYFDIFCARYAEATKELKELGYVTAGLQVYVEVAIVGTVDARPARPATAPATATAIAPGPTSLLPAVAPALASSSVVGVRVPVTSGLGGVSASLPPASVSGSVPLGDVSGIVSTGLPSISIPGGLTSSTSSLPGLTNLFPTATNPGATTVAPTVALPATRPSESEVEVDNDRTPRASTRPATPMVRQPLALKPVGHAEDVFGPIIGHIKTTVTSATTGTGDKDDDDRTPRAAARPATSILRRPLAPRPVGPVAESVFGPIFGPIKTAVTPATDSSQTTIEVDEEKTPRAPTRPAAPIIRRPLAPKAVGPAQESVIGPIFATIKMNPRIESERLDKPTPTKLVVYQDSPVERQPQPTAPLKLAVFQDSPDAGQSRASKRASIGISSMKRHIPSNCGSPRQPLALRHRLC